jgi:hypothetical protein
VRCCSRPEMITAPPAAVGDEAPSVARIGTKRSEFRACRHRRPNPRSHLFAGLFCLRSGTCSPPPATRSITALMSYSRFIANRDAQLHEFRRPEPCGATALTHRAQHRVHRAALPQVKAHARRASRGDERDGVVRLEPHQRRRIGADEPRDLLVDRRQARSPIMSAQSAVEHRPGERLHRCRADVVDARRDAATPRAVRAVEAVVPARFSPARAQGRRGAPVACGSARSS